MTWRQSANSCECPGGRRSGLLFFERPLIGGLLAYLATVVLVSSPYVRLEKEARYLTFTAKGRHDVYLRDLKPEEIELKLDGEPVEVRYLGGKNVDTAYVFLLENSPRTARFNISRPQWGQVNIIDEFRYQMQSGFFFPLCRQGTVLLAEFDEDVRILQNFTSREFQLDDALNRIRPNSSGLDLDRYQVGKALAQGVNWLEDRTEKRKMLVLFTTIVDFRTHRNLEEYREMLRLSDIELFVVSHAGQGSQGPGAGFEARTNRYFFQKLVKETSGRLFLTGEFVYLDELFTDLKARLLNSYTIGFYVEAGRPATTHPIELRIRREKIEITCRPSLIY